MCPDLTSSDQDAVIWCSSLVCYLDNPSGDIQTPNILDDCLGESIYIYFTLFCDDSVSVSSLSDSHHLPSGSLLKSIRFHFVFYTLTCTPVVLASPAKNQGPFVLV